MIQNFKAIEAAKLQANPFNLIGKEWMLVTAGTLAHFNTMTASWGGLGELWNRQVAFVFVRPQRYTFEFIERATDFTLTFFGREHRPALNFCGSHSGRDVDKIAATGLTPLAADNGAVYFAEARLVFECRKLYAQDFQERSFIMPDIAAEVYPTKDYHRMYIAEIVACWAR